MIDNCPLGLECVEGDVFFHCVNALACHYWTDVWDLYEILFLGEDFPSRSS